jgi:hypothetical protein
MRVMLEPTYPSGVHERYSSLGKAPEVILHALMLASKAGAYPSGAPFKFFCQGRPSSLLDQAEKACLGQTR